jgi:group I intron endonuclease
MHYLYKITNTLNNKVYIGQSNKETERWRQHKYYSKLENPVQYISRAMKKYGVDNFTYEVIAQCLSQKDADETEIELIKQYDSQNKEFGYNVAPGGDHSWNAGLPKEQQPMYGKKQSEHQKQRMSEVHSGKIVIISEETKQKISKSLIGHSVSDKVLLALDDYNKNRTFTEETRIKMSESQTGRVHSEITKSKMSSTRKGKYTGENSSQSKINWNTVTSIRVEYSLGNISQAKLAKKYKVSATLISLIVNNKIWIELL